MKESGPVFETLWLEKYTETPNSIRNINQAIILYCHVKPSELA
jgi:hypothetical protein